MSITVSPQTASGLRVDETGTIRVGPTRVTLDTLVACFEQGDSAETIRQAFPTLELADVYAAIAYYLRHKEELDAYLAGREREAQEFRERNPELFAHDFQERLLARADSSGK